MTEKYIELIKKVAKIDINAATYMLSEAPRLRSFIIHDKLTGVFAFHETPQGSLYWMPISIELNK